MRSEDKLVPLTIKNMWLLEEMGQTNRAENIGRLLCGMAFVLIEDDHPVAAGGIYMLFPGTGKAWTCTAMSISQKTFRRVHRIVKEELPVVRRAMRLQRVEADTKLDPPGHCAWLKRLGFEFEGVMRSYYRGEDYARFAWVR